MKKIDYFKARESLELEDWIDSEFCMLHLYLYGFVAYLIIHNGHSYWWLLIPGYFAYKTFKVLVWIAQRMK